MVAADLLSRKGLSELDEAGVRRFPLLASPWPFDRNTSSVSQACKAIAPQPVPSQSKFEFAKIWIFAYTKIQKSVRPKIRKSELIQIQKYDNVAVRICAQAHSHTGAQA